MHTRTAFTGATSGRWRVLSLAPVCGEPLAPASHVDVGPATAAAPAGSAWSIEAVASNVRYATRDEVMVLRARQQGLGRPEATRAALIPITKSAAWWALAQDERRAIFEAQSEHTRIGLDYLPAIARQLYHCRDLGQPFDFVTWFEYAPEHAAAFDALVARLRRTPEWSYVTREVDIRLARAD